ncbi:MAG: lipoate--protein ligase family protein [Cyclobacteriaceae bacterium]|nr:lipoate--protein ligase family protein [Cyclobacteriaceae bacterium]
MKIRWIDAGRVSDIRSQSIYHGLGYSLNEQSPNTIVMSIPENPYMCVGYFQDPNKELDLKYCKENSLPVIRRQTGGGAVYIDNKQLFVQWIFHPKSIPQKVEQKFQIFIKPMIETYKFFGIDAYEYGGHDVHVNGKKIVGTGAAYIGNAEVVTGNFIKEFDSKHMIGALKLPNERMRNEVNHSMSKYMSSLSEEVVSIPNFDEVKMVYKQMCEKIHGMKFIDDNFTDEELLEIENQEYKLQNDSWTFSIKQPEKKCRLIKIHTGIWVGNTSYQAGDQTLNITMRLNENIVDYINIDFTDNQHKKVIDLLETKLMKLALTEENLSIAIGSFFNLQGSDWSFLTKEQWIEALMMIYIEKKKISGGG